ncbi:MAG TPA: sulfite exporter TauE/SafE family protein [Candidatus Eisenbacteria bacterium]|nr:sulfite exporter TauE/SafE family protein [Candidatus Eisenbacteria bacterium]
MSWGDAAAIAAGLFAGFLSGTIGIGGGLAFVPIMTIGFRMPQQLAQGTSLAAIIPTALVGGITHLRQGNVRLDAAIWMGGGGVVGAVIGALVAVDLPTSLLARLFGVFLLFSAYRIAMGARRPTVKSQADPKHSV